MTTSNNDKINENSEGTQTGWHVASWLLLFFNAILVILLVVLGQCETKAYLQMLQEKGFYPPLLTRWFISFDPTGFNIVFFVFLGVLFLKEVIMSNKMTTTIQNGLRRRVKIT